MLPPGCSSGARCDGVVGHGDERDREKRDVSKIIGRVLGRRGDCAADRQSRQKMGKNCQGVATCPERNYCSMKLASFASFAQAAPRKAKLQSRYRFLSACLAFFCPICLPRLFVPLRKKTQGQKESEREGKKHP
ncbi:hypothetical protein V8C44DRAFT_275330 [Trichoderma aethiopicum]